MKHFDVIVVGGGHAGVEAALAAGRRGARVALITFRAQDLGVMSCNPAIGGIGKGHLVREIDALDGIMGLAADYAGIQYRLLNRSRGPAVQGPRVQADRARYARFIQAHVASVEAVEVITGEVVDFRLQAGRVTGVLLADGTGIEAHAIVLTSGTFLGGEIHIGSERVPAGRQNAPSARKLGQRLRELATGIGRLKTGTPARLNGKSIDWARVGRQEGDADPVMMSFRNSRPEARQIACGVTETNSQTHEIIAQNLHLSAMRSGNISGVGPRYCPSVEDKVTRFADKNAHLVYLEPEGLEDDTIYPNGISTSLPRDVQTAFLRTIKGLESVEILQHGYAIEYDFLDPRGLNSNLEMRALPGLFLAGQINGTTGYEEAAAQGLLAGANAAAVAKGLGPLIMSRFNSYIGVMVDDLVTRGVTEPYRMFTSRAEYRLSLRADNADQRLTPLGVSSGLVGEARRAEFDSKHERLQDLKARMACSYPDDADLSLLALSAAKPGQKRAWLAIAGQLVGAQTEGDAIAQFFPEDDAADLAQIARDAFYAPYVDRQLREAAQLQRGAVARIPEDMDFSAMPSISNELRQKLAMRRPATLGEAEKIEGMTPAALTALLAHIRIREQVAHVADR